VSVAGYLSGILKVYQLRNQSGNNYDRGMPRSHNSKAISEYYDSLTDEEREEVRLWAEFAEAQFSLDSACEFPSDLSHPPGRL